MDGPGLRQGVVLQATVTRQCPKNIARANQNYLACCPAGGNWTTIRAGRKSAATDGGSQRTSCPSDTSSTVTMYRLITCFLSHTWPFPRIPLEMERGRGRLCLFRLCHGRFASRCPSTFFPPPSCAIYILRGAQELYVPSSVRRAQSCLMYFGGGGVDGECGDM